MTAPYLLLALGIVCAALGGELFVRGVVGIARWLRISAGIIGATFAAFATSSPELSVSVNSALAATPQIALGDALGSNVVNIGLILGLALCFAPLHTERDVLRRDFSAALCVPLLLALLSADGQLGRLDGLCLLLLFAVWLVAVVLEVRRQRSAAPAMLGEVHHTPALVQAGTGLGLLVAAGMLIVAGAKGIAQRHGIDPFLVGATLVAIGTSAPEIATVVIARLRQHDEVGLGTLLGSNIFNGLFIVGVAAAIHPIAINAEEVAIGLSFGLLTSLFALPLRGSTLGRQRGILLLTLYAAYLLALLRTVG